MPKSQDVQGNDVLGWAFTKLWSATAFSNLADGILKTAAPLAAVRLTDSPLLLGGLAAALYLPWLLFSLPAGVIADRADRRKVMLAGQAVRIIVATLVTLAFVTDIASIYLLYVAAFLIGTAEVLYDITAQAILPQVVSKKALSKANARQQGVEIATNQFIGPPLGGLMVGASVALAMGVPAALWVLAFGLLAWMPGRYRPQRIIATGGDTPAVSNWRARLYADVREGLGYLFRHRILRTLALMTGLTNLATAATGAVFVLFAVGADSPMGLTDAGFGLLVTTLAAGAILGSLLAQRAIRRLGRARSIGFAIVAETGMAVVPAITTSVWIIGAVWAVAGFGLMLWNVTVVTLRQSIIPEPLMGRVNSAYRLLGTGTAPLGALLGGLLGELFGLRAVFIVGATLVALAGFGLFVVRERAIEAAIAAG